VPWLDANGISIHYQLAGEGPSLVLLHEMGGTLDSWDGLFSALSQRFRVLRYDQRGSGLSEKVRQPTSFWSPILHPYCRASRLPRLIILSPLLPPPCRRCSI
jgi:pimeloyl-ACP methyl ester carboxylesterase